MGGVVERGALMVPETERMLRLRLLVVIVVVVVVRVEGIVRFGSVHKRHFPQGNRTWLGTVPGLAEAAAAGPCAADGCTGARRGGEAGSGRRSTGVGPDGCRAGRCGAHEWRR